MATKKLIDPEVCPAGVTADIFGCSLQHLRNLKKSGEISESGRGKYNLQEIATYMLQANKADMSELQKAKLKSEQQKARRELRVNDQASGLLVSIEEVGIFLHGYTGELIQFVESIKKSIGAKLEKHDRKEFYKKHEEARSELAEKLEAWRDHSLSNSDSDASANS